MKIIDTLKEWKFRIKDYPRLEGLYGKTQNPHYSDVEGWSEKWKQAIVSYSAPLSKHVTKYLTYKQIDEIDIIVTELKAKVQKSQMNGKPTSLNSIIKDIEK